LSARGAGRQVRRCLSWKLDSSSTNTSGQGAPASCGQRVEHRRADVADDLDRSAGGGGSAPVSVAP
jgi:hypothetical protein